MELENNDPILVILMRNDLDSMNPGKACAQASHAANQMVFAVENDIQRFSQIKLLNEWRSETGMGFGTVHVRAGWWNKIESWFDIEGDNLAAAGVVWGKVFDPTYPVRDGTNVFYVPIHTCAYAFGRRSDLVYLEKAFGFMP